MYNSEHFFPYGQCFQVVGGIPYFGCKIGCMPYFRCNKMAEHAYFHNYETDNDTLYNRILPDSSSL